ncbi:hypothetical protein A3H15_03070 [Candidatus Kaiserbacteria bacterium RIFCSPLOWO2_12_FULL_50_28]|uniref:DUF8173 domain-containing protein n=1 Tax=Candidatus Kaiserbacteria bacterium RIFCSPLOWO2_12_FULL_50_28 TaxID=1798527 RepID=A0A1F6FKP0_9BACT|nr:MAG: hypothetical protein A3H15_03070 [Candidatus Kaiserbacteria bacterium RIFCSPLOWO2_12_FULL_50_28]
MKLRNTLCASLLLAVLFPVGAFAATIKGGETYSLKQSEVIKDNFYVGAGEVSIAGDVDGDLIAGGGSVTVSGSTSGDVLVGGGDVAILDDVRGDLRVAGGNVLVTSNVAGDLVVLGGNVRILSGSTIGKDLVVLGGRLLLNGNVKGDVTVGVGEVEIDSRIDGDVYIKNSDKITIGASSVISGNLTYSGKDASILNISDGASVMGETVFKESKIFQRKEAKNILLAFLGLFVFLKLLALLVVVILSVVLFKRFSSNVVETVVQSPGKELIRGFAVLIVIPALIILSFFTMIGFLVGIITLLAYITLIILSSIYSGVVLGVWAHKIITKGDDIMVDWKTALFGTIALSLIVMLPIIGWIVGAFFFLVSLGSISNTVYHGLWLNRD